MRITSPFRWFLAACLLSLASLSSAQATDERIPQRDANQEYPRWLAQIRVDGLYKASQFVSAPSAVVAANMPSIAVDSKNVVHIVYSGYDEAAHVASLPGGAPPREIFYTHNRFKDRRSNSWSPPIKLAVTPKDSVWPDIAVGTDDKVHVVWCEYVESSPTIAYTTITYTDADGVFVDTMSGVGLDSHVTPAIALDPANGRHIVAKHALASPPHVSYTYGAAGGSFTGSEKIEGSDNPRFPRIDYNKAIGAPDVVWVNEGFKIAKYARRTSSGWTSPVDVSDTGVGMADIACFDIETHFTWDRLEAPVKVQYRKVVGAGSSATLSPIENVNDFGGYMPKIVMDTRDQPHIVWRGGGVGLSYACKKHRSDGDYWGRQEPIGNVNRTPFGRVEICINRNDNVYLTFDNYDESSSIEVKPPYIGIPDGGGFGVDGTQIPYFYNPWPGGITSGYSWQTTEYPGGTTPEPTKRGATFFSKMIEFDLGDQDMYGMVWAGPGTLVNSTNGNAAFDLLLFAARGVGFPPAALLAYNSMEWDSGFMAQGWRLNYQIVGTKHEDGIVSIQMGDGRTIQFVPGGDLTVFPQPEFGEFSRIQGMTRFTKGGIQYTFDFDTGKLISVEDTNGNTLNLAYDLNLQGKKGLLSSIEDSSSRSVSFSHTDGRLTSITDPAGHTYTLTYTGKLLTSVTLNGPPAVTWSFQYAAGGNLNMLATVETPNGNTTGFDYYADHRFKKSTDPQAKVGSIEYSSPATYGAGPFSATVKDRRANSTTLETQYKRSVVDKVTDPMGKSITRTFDGIYRNMTGHTDREGNVTSFGYGSDGNVHDLLLEVKEPDANSGAGGGATTPTAKFTYSHGIFKVVAVEDATGAKVKYHFDNLSSYPAEPNLNVFGGGNPTQIVYPDVAGQGVALEEMVWDSQGRMTSHKSPRNVASGGATSFLYGDPITGLVTSVTRPLHTTPESFSYDVMGLLTSHTLANGGTETFEYDGLYRIKMATEPAGDAAATTSYVFDLNSNLKEVHSPGGAMSTGTYDSLDRLTDSSSLVAGLTSISRSYDFDEEGNVLSSTDPNGHVVSATYDALNRVSTQTMPGGAGGADVTTSFAYDGEGRVLSRTTGGVTYSATYTARGTPLTTTNPNFPDESDETTYTDDGRVLKSIHKVAGVPKYGQKNTYDERRRLIATTRITDFDLETGPTTTFTLDVNGNVVKVTDPEGRFSETEYDLADRLLRTKDGTGQILSEIAYNDSDLQTSIMVADPMGGALVLDRSFTYNARNQLKTSTDFFGAVTSFLYDARGNLVRRDLPTISDGQVCFDTFEYDLLNRLTKETRNEGTADAISISYGYDSAGNRTSMTDARGFVYSYVFDDSNRMIERHYPNIGAETFVESWTYDDRGNVATYTDCAGKVTTWTYDLKNRPLTETHVKSSVTLANIVRVYDGSNNLVSVTDTVSKIRISFTDDSDAPAYDALTRLTQVRWFLEVGTPDEVIWKEVKYQNPDGTPGYDAASNLVSMIDPEGNHFKYTYNSNSLLNKVKRKAPGGTMEVIADFNYRPNHLKKSVTYIGGTETTWKYDEKSRVTSIQSLAPDTVTVLSHFKYDYDAKDRRAKAHLVHLGADIDYDYDPHDRLTGEKWKNAYLRNAKWTYDAAGNRATQKVDGLLTSYSYDAQNRLTSETKSGVTTSYVNDRNGNRTKKTVGTATEENYGFDYMNRISAYAKSPIGLPATTSFQYLFTPTAERIAKIDLLSPAANEQWVMSDGADVTADYTRTTGTSVYTLERTYANGRAIDSKLARFDNPGDVTYLYLGDALGTVHQEATTTGTVVRQDLTTAWGEAHPGYTPVSTVSDRYGFTGRENDNESGLMHYRARSYDPATGRFTSRDPVFHANLYAYTRNSPTNAIDPTGQLDSEELAALNEMREESREVDPVLSEMYDSYIHLEDIRIARSSDSAAVERAISTLEQNIITRNETPRLSSPDDIIRAYQEAVGRIPDVVASGAALALSEDPFDAEEFLEAMSGGKYKSTEDLTDEVVEELSELTDKAKGGGLLPGSNPYLVAVRARFGTGATGKSSLKSFLRAVRAASSVKAKIKVDMSEAPALSKTVKGIPRNGPWFWRRVLKSNPEMFSKGNKFRINHSHSPKVDEVWIQHNPEHAPYKGDKLIHHHIKQGKLATPLPQQVHRQGHGVLHDLGK